MWAGAKHHIGTPYHIAGAAYQTYVVWDSRKNNLIPIFLPLLLDITVM